MNLGLVEMMRYNAWANRTLLDSCRELTDEQLDARLPVTSGSTRELLIHIVGGQQTFALRTKGRQHEGELDRGGAWPGMAEITRLAGSTSDELILIAAQLDPESETDLPYFGKVYRYPTLFFLVHAAEHGVEHRTEVKLNLAHAGVDTPDLDGWAYGEAAGYGAEL
ncbi:MAG TPA: DinB family protein [Candidatus Binatia bacterium]|nr:DinB family protein [Candidatus Binatia bacterium]